MFGSGRDTTNNHQRQLRRRSPEFFLIRFIVLAGVLLPWLVAVTVKISLDVQGQPTWDWLYFLHPGRLLAEIWATLWLGLPSFTVAFLASLLFSGRVKWAVAFNRIEKWILVLISSVWGAVASAKVFVELFSDFSPISLLLPFFWTVLYTDDYVYGLLVGGALAGLSSLGRKLFKGIRQASQ